MASPDTTIWVGDVLYITGEVSNVNRFAEDFLMEMLDGHTTEEASKADKSLDFYDIGIAEIVLMPSSNIVNRTVKEAGFRDKFNVNVLGIRRKRNIYYVNWDVSVCIVVMFCWCRVRGRTSHG